MSDKVIVLTFDEPVQAGTGDIVLSPSTGASISIGAGDGQVSYSGPTVSITPSSALATLGVEYSVTIPSTAVEDLWDNQFAGLGSTAYNFKMADTVRPGMVLFHPVQGAMGHPATSPIVLQFSEAVQAGEAGNIVLTPSLGADVVQPSAVVIASGGEWVQYNSTNVTITPVELSTIGVNYTVSIQKGAITDRASFTNSSTVYSVAVNNTFTLDGEAQPSLQIQALNKCVRQGRTGRVHREGAQGVQGG